MQAFTYSPASTGIEHALRMAPPWLDGSPSWKHWAPCSPLSCRLPASRLPPHRRKNPKGSEGVPLSPSCACLDSDPPAQMKRVSKRGIGMQKYCFKGRAKGRPSVCSKLLCSWRVPSEVLPAPCTQPAQPTHLSHHSVQDQGQQVSQQPLPCCHQVRWQATLLQPLQLIYWLPCSADRSM